MNYDEYLFFDDTFMMENELQDDIKDMWVSNGVHIEDVDARVAQVIVGVRYRGKVVGVMTRNFVTLDNHEETAGKQIAFIREFIDKEHRSFKLHKDMFWRGINIIKNRAILDGIVFNTENKKFERPGYEKRLVNNGFTKLPTKRDDVVWYMLF